ncbi:hypothetical protein [Mesorhizobium sp. B2-4-7]|uniref:phage major tropism determinant n=1 Tax=Mesorhizobium sp. B2-4-7 TaxID=2589942 RepID=UPI00112AB34E|nr:hypothetical protein [Mesorhizobium sp. B2-4-7]TPL30195.1 hypothetical protein FJ946_02700 [Mesorhizobium sp. B2-4-7]
MTTAAHKFITIDRADLSAPIFAVTGADAIAVKAGTILTIDGVKTTFEQDGPIEIASLVPGQDYAVRLGAEGTPVAAPAGPDCGSDTATFGGFHYAPSGNADARAGGDAAPAINPLSCWDVGFRPACPDPRGMALVDGKVWVDIYLLGTNHLDDGTSHCGALIADGRDLPQQVDGKGRTKKLDYATAVAIYAHHGKQLLGAEEFFAAAYGVTERQSRDAEPTETGDVSGDGKKFVSRAGILDATGTMWQWGTDGDPDNPRPALFGGSWFSGRSAGSHCADLVYDWPGHSVGDFSARGRSDHLSPA